MSDKTYNTTALACSQIVTKNYSTSFTLGIRLLHVKYQSAIYGIYAFVRFADEIVDTFHEQDKSQLLQEFKDETNKAIQRKISSNPVLHTFQQVVHQHQIPQQLIASFFESMAMDLEHKTHNTDTYEQYIFGSAEVVGLMCLRIFCDGDEDLYNELMQPAKCLGAAFQKVNFLRDMKDDYLSRGRVYFPNVDMQNFDNYSKKNIENDIAKDFKNALNGIYALPTSSRIGVYVAYKYYLRLFKKIKKCSPQRVLKKRIRINNAHKASILLRSYTRYKLNIL